MRSVRGMGRTWHSPVRYGFACLKDSAATRAVTDAVGRFGQGHSCLRPAFYSPFITRDVIERPSGARDTVSARCPHRPAAVPDPQATLRNLRAATDNPVGDEMENIMSNIALV